jgi:spermidine/putrescine transport system ATP-binding protein
MSVHQDACRLTGLSRTYGKGAAAHHALAGIDLTIAANEFFTLLGPSGCGKTTLLRLIGGFDQPTAGQISIFGRDVAGLPPEDRPVNTVFQHYALFPHLTVAENIGFALRMLGRPRVEAAATVARMLALVGLEGMEGRRPDQLSGGQKQRVALARALAPGPKILLLDEPLSALDAKLRQRMRSELKALQRETGIAFVFVTHDQDEALAMSDRIAVMQGGRIQQVGRPEEIYETPANRFVADFIGGANLIPARIGAGGAAAAGLGMIPAEGQAGEAVTLAIRPERLGLVAEAARQAGDLGPLRVAERIYMGNELSFRLEGAEVPLHVTLPRGGLRGAQDFAPGDLVCLRPEPGALRVLAS